MLPTLLIAASLGLAQTPPGTALLGPATADNLQARLVRGGQDRTAAGRLQAVFLTIDDGPPREIVVRFNSGRQTTHEATLVQVIHSALSPPTSAGEDAKADKLDVVFSIPRQPDGLDLSRWYIVSVAAPKPAPPK